MNDAGMAPITGKQGDTEHHRGDPAGRADSNGWRATSVIVLIGLGYFEYVILLFWYCCILVPRPEKVVNYLKWLSPTFLEITLALAGIGFVLCAKDTWALFCSISRRTRVALSLLAVAVFLVACFVAPRTHRIYYDEDIYGDIAVGIATNNEAAMTSLAEWEDGQFKIINNEYNKQPNAHPLILSIIYRIFGPTELLSHVANNCATAATVVLTFLVGWLIFRRESLAFLAAVVLATIPNLYRWGNTMAAEPMTVAFITLAIFCTLFFCRKNLTSRFFLLVAVVAFTVQFRPETLLLLFILVLIVLLYRPMEFLSPRTYAMGLLFLALITPHLVHIHVFRGEKWGAEREKFSLLYLWSDGVIPTGTGRQKKTQMSPIEAFKTGEWKDGNLFNNVRFFVADPERRFPPLYAVLFLAGIAALGACAVIAHSGQKYIPGQSAKNYFFCPDDPGYGLLILLAWFALFWGIFLLFYAGSYYYGADDRFSLLVYPPLALIAGAALFILERLLRRISSFLLSYAVLSAGFLLLFGRYLAVIQAQGSEAWLARDDHAFAVELCEKLPPQSMVISHDPCIFVLRKVSAAQIGFVYSHPNVIDRYLQRTPERVFIYAGFWAVIDDKTQNRMVTDLAKWFELEEVERRESRHFDVDHRYILRLFRVLRRKPPSKPRIPATSQDRKKDARAGSPEAPANKKTSSSVVRYFGHPEGLLP